MSEVIVETTIEDITDIVAEKQGYKHVKLTRAEAAAARDAASIMIKQKLQQEAGSVKADGNLESIYQDALPEGVTMEHVAAVDQTDAIMTAATIKAVGEVALDAIAGDKSLTAVNGSVTVRESLNVDLRVKGQHVYPGMVRNGEKLPDTTVYGDSRAVISRKVTSPSAGLLGSTRDELSTLAEKMFADK